MSNKSKKRAASAEKDETPLVTIGDLRKRLSALGNPWEPDPTLSDDEPMPQYPTGGDGTMDAPGLLADDLDELLKKGAPPANAELQKLWRKAGLLGKEQSAKSKQSRKRDRSEDRG